MTLRFYDAFYWCSLEQKWILKEDVKKVNGRAVCPTCGKLLRIKSHVYGKSRVYGKRKRKP